jgi:hypothetical protein
MKNVNQIFTNLRKAVNGSKPNTKYKQIMAYIDALEDEVFAISAVEESIYTSEEEGYGVEEEVMLEINDTDVEWDELDHSEIDEVEEVNEEVIDEVEEEDGIEVNLEELNLTELRALYPDIKATSKEKFLEQINNQ